MDRPALCEACGQALEQTTRGRKKRYCSDGCRLRAFRRREALSVWAQMPEDVPIEPAQQTPTDEQVARAILEARTIGYTFTRLGVEARPSLAWRCAKLGQGILDALSDSFPNLR